RIKPTDPELVSAQCDEQTVAECFPDADGAHYLQPAGDPAALLARARPPATARGHDDEGRQRGVAARDPRGYVERLRRGATNVRNKRGLGARGRLLMQPLSL